MVVVAVGNWLNAYKWDELWKLLKPGNDESEHIDNESVDSISVVCRIGAVLKQEVHIYVEVASQILSGLEGTQTLQVIIDESFKSLFFLNNRY